LVYFIARQFSFHFADLEQKFYDYFFTGETELRLSYLLSVKQKIHEGVSEYIRSIEILETNAIV